MTNNPNNTNTAAIQNSSDELNDLLNEAKEVGKEINAINDATEKEINEIGKKVDSSVDKLEQIFSELDETEEAAGNELDKLIIEQSEVLSDAF